MTARNRPIALAAGGTGGHVFPAQSLADLLSPRGYRIALITDRRETALDGALAAADIHRINAAGVSGTGLLRRVIAMAKLGMGYFEARKIIRAIDPIVVVGFGSYASVPTVLAATRLHRKTIIHEQNAILGRANRFLAPRVTRIATAFQTVGHLRDEDRTKTVWTGNPVRPDIISIAGEPYPALDEGGRVNLLIFGGSLGATVFSEIVPATLASLPQTLRGRLRVVQQCRAADIDAVRDTYAAANIDAELAPFFSDMPKRLAAAHLVICRSGASTVAELSAAGRPAILVPYPHATDDHQTKNAEILCDAGGGWIMPQGDFDSANLAARLTALMSNTRMLRTTALCAGRIGVRKAAENLAELVLDVVGAPDNDEHGTDTGSSREAAE